MSSTVCVEIGLLQLGQYGVPKWAYKNLVKETHKKAAMYPTNGLRYKSLMQWKIIQEVTCFVAINLHGN